MDATVTKVTRASAYFIRKEIKLVMTKVLSNFEVELFMKTLSEKDNFLYKTRLPHAIRQALRVNMKLLTERYEIYQEGRSELILSYIKDGKAKQSGDKITFEKDCVDEVNKELIELASVTNEINFEAINKEVLNGYLENTDLTLTEEDILLFFCEE